MDKENKGMLTAREMALSDKCLRAAMKAGASKARITLSKSLMESRGTLNGDLDKVSSCLDRSLTICLFADGRYGGFSTNRLVEGELDSFIAKAISTVRMLSADPCRDLPSPERTAKDAVTGNELELNDPAYWEMTPGKRLETALQAAAFKNHISDGIVSEEGEYSDSISDIFVIDSNGLRCRHTETSFEYGVETTVKGPDGNKYSSYWWDSSPTLRGLNSGTCGEEAFRRAKEQIGPKAVQSGKYTMVIDNENSSRLVTPLLNALGGYALQQKNSFLLDSLGKKIFPEWLSIEDRPRSAGKAGSRLFDSEGVAATDAMIVEKGIVKEYFINTYISRKLGVPPTIEDASRPWIPPCFSPSLKKPETFNREGLMRAVSNGILVTGFNGGNSDSATGDFSFGVQGFLFKDGKIEHPIRETLITGNMITLWNNLLAAGEDYRLCKSKLIPTLAFGNVDFSA